MPVSSPADVEIAHALITVGIREVTRTVEDRGE